MKGKSCGGVECQGALYTVVANDAIGTTEISRQASVVGGLSGLVQSFFDGLNRTVRMRV